MDPSTSSMPPSPPPPARSASDLASTSYHTLSSILNNPHVGKSGVYSSDASWSGWFGAAASSPAPPDLAPPLLPKTTTLPDVSRASFDPYISAISDQFSRFADIRHHERHTADLGRTSSDLARSFSDVGVAGPGEALVACLREVPSLYFKEDFALEEGSTFGAACPFATAAENLVLQEKLSHYLDVVELHLVREIALRSDSFFEAQGQLQDLNGGILEACACIQGLKEKIRLLEGDVVGSARQIQDSDATRKNLLALQQKLKLILYVNQAQTTLKLLIAAADCAGALDVTDDLQQLLDGDDLIGLHCFRHLRDQLAMSIDAINSILSSEFMRACILETKYVGYGIKLGSVNPMSNKNNGNNLEEEESSNLREQLVPLIIGLLRTAKLPSVLRDYRDGLVAGMKIAIKNTVDRFLASWTFDSDEAVRQVESDSVSLSLGSKLRSLSPYGFVQLLDAIFRVVQAHLIRALEVKKVVEWIMGNLDGCFSTGVFSSSNFGHTEKIGDYGSSLSSSDNRNNASGFISVYGKAIESSISPNATKDFRADVLRENAEAVFAACDAAHGKWAKLLAFRSQLHPKLRLQEFVSIYGISQDFMVSTEKIGGRSCFSIRGALQSQSKAFVDLQHDTRMTKIKAVLDQETWAPVDVPHEFQSIVDSLASFECLSNGDAENGYANLTTSRGEVEAEGSGNYLGASLGEVIEVDRSGLNGDIANTVQHVIPASQSISHRGISYHMVNCGLILLKMLSEYIDINRSLPLLSSEIIGHVCEILRLFNSRAGQLVLGAAAMQVSGLKSITSKHLALSSQAASFMHAIIPDVKRVLLMQITDSRKAQLKANDLDKLAEDYKVHSDEIHTKLVQIMRERVLAHLRTLPQIVDGWNKPEDGDPHPSQFARSLVKEVTYLNRVLSRILLEVDVQLIFRQVAQILHSQIFEALSPLVISTPQANNRLIRDLQHILLCIRSLPTANLNEAGITNYGMLDDLLAQRSGTAATS